MNLPYRMMTMWIALNEMSGMSQLIDCGETMWMTGMIGFIVGALIGTAVGYFLRNWD